MLIMQKIRLFYLAVLIFISSSCTQKLTAVDIVNKVITAVDTIETIYYKQDMLRSNPRQPEDTIFRHREMYFKRLIGDSLVGVKGHWYMYVNDTVNVIFEDIYDGDRLIRKNNRDSVIRVYDFIKYPEFRQKPFWGHNTLYGMQHALRYMLDHMDSYNLNRINDTIFLNKLCFQISVLLENMTSAPGFATKLVDAPGAVSRTVYIIDRQTYYPLGMKAVNHDLSNPDQRFFIDQTYYDIQFNIEIDDKAQFNTSTDSFSGYAIKEIRH